MTAVLVKKCCTPTQSNVTVQTRLVFSLENQTVVRYFSLYSNKKIKGNMPILLKTHYFIQLLNYLKPIREYRYVGYAVLGIHGLLLHKPGFPKLRHILRNEI